MNDAIFCLTAVLALSALHATAAPGVEVKASQFVRTKYLTPQQQQDIRQKGFLHFSGEAEYEFAAPATGWYEFWVEAAQWATSLYLDGEFLIHTPFASGVWPPRGRLQKVMNLHLAQGKHTLRFVRTWHPGLPWMRRFVIEPARDVTGMAQWRLKQDYLCFRKGESFPLVLRAGRLPRDDRLIVNIVAAANGKTAAAIAQTVPAGSGVFEKALSMPTDREGVFDIKLTDAQGQSAARVIQYLVVDTKTPPPAPAALKRELVETLDCATRKPDYVSSPTRVVPAAFGAYRESGDRGNAEQGLDADWFAYTLRLPSVQEPYLVEIDYPDDDERTFTYAIIEKNLPGGRALTHGIASGGIYPLTNRMQTTAILFYPRQRDPRLLLRTWWDGQRAAAAQIRVYRITSGFPPLFPPAAPAKRLFGRFQEEPLRFVQWGARPEGNRWRNLWDAAERIGQFSRYVGVNFWQPTIAIYGSRLWPSKFLPSLDPDADKWGTIGPSTLKEPVAKDSVRLLLLLCEKYGMKFVGELFMPGSRHVARAYFEERVAGDGDTAWEKALHNKPWLIVDRTGASPGTPLYNPLYPGVQEWVADIVRELAQRYKDSPAFVGVSLRFMGWQFHSWQGFPSINWGYGDWTIRLFEKETGVKIPVDNHAPGRFQKRYEWLMANAYDKWVQWRCRKIYAYHARLAKRLTDARPDLKLYLELYGPNFGRDATQQARDAQGWTGLLRETGLAPKLYRPNSALAMRVVRVYPPGRRGIQTKDPVVRAARIEEAFDPKPLEAASRPAAGGSVCTVHTDANSFESNMVKVKWLGLGERLGGKETEIHGAGLVFPAGRHFLSRFANAMADGNVDSFVDGSHGYIMWPPRNLREFTAEYGLLPDIGMTRLKRADDPVALWQGESDGRRTFYLANRAAYSVRAEVRFDRGGQARRLRTGETFEVGRAQELSVELKSYELAVFECPAPMHPVALRIVVPDAVRGLLRGQLDFARKLLALKDAGQEIMPFSLMDLQRARRKCAEAEEAFLAGRYCAARRALRHHELVKIYAALAACPPDLFYRKAPRRPKGALGPRELLDKTAAEARSAARLVPAAQIAPSMAGEQALAWEGRPLTLRMDAPVANRYRFSFAYIAKPPYGRPVFCLASETPHAARTRWNPIPGQEAGAAEENGRWGRLTIPQPLTLAQGAHRVRVRPGQAAAALLYVHLQPIYRDIVARDWKVVGPFPSQPRFRKVGAGMNRVFPPERERNYLAQYTGDGGKTLSWIRPASDAPYVDLYALTGEYSDKVSYAATVVESPETRPAVLQFGVDYWARMWLNGEQVFEVAAGHGSPRAGQFAIPIQLRKGRNALLLKIHAGSAGNGFWLSISDPGDLRLHAPFAKGHTP